jgi:hypothetical protein
MDPDGSGNEPDSMPWTIEELQAQVEVELAATPISPTEIAQLADVLRPYFEDPRFRTIVIRGVEDQQLPPPRHVMERLAELAETFDTTLQFRTRFPQR